jgi:CHAT domain-containing protein
VDRSELPISNSELQARIAEVMKAVGAQMLEETSGATIPDPALEELHRLATILLPESLFDDPAKDSSVRTLFLTPDRCVASLPFGLLNLAEEGYRPLIERFDPIYLNGRPTPYVFDRYERSGADDASLPALVVANPSLGSRNASVFGDVASLDQGLAEAETVADLRPGALVLSAQTATKDRVIENWERTSLLYIVAHVLRDPEVAYLACIPLWSTSEQPSEDPYLDVTAIRRTRFAANPLVVLSGCASGASYVESEVVAPGLGQAFLDAGASAVIQTFWDVRDDVASTLMQRTMEAWMRDGLRPDQALNAARREFASSGAERSHPFFWASYFIELNAETD